MSNFANLRKTSNNLDEIRDRVVGKPQENTNFYPETDKAGRGRVVLRFLPNVDGVTNLVEYRMFNATNSAGTKTYKAKSRTTLKQSDPYAEYLQVLWDKQTEYAHKLRSDRKSKLRRVAWVYVVDDKITPENNGKIMLYYLPAAVAKAIKEAIDPPEDPYSDEQVQPFNPFDIYGDSGRDFNLVITRDEGNRSYKSSYFEKVATPWLDSEEQMEKLWTENVKDLKEMFLDESKYPTYEEALKMLVETFGQEEYSAQIFKDLFGDKLDGLDMVETDSNSNSLQETRTPANKSEPEEEAPKNEDVSKKIEEVMGSSDESDDEYF